MSENKRDMDSRTRSVDNLQRIYTFVVSLAVTEALRGMFGKGSPWPEMGKVLMFFGMIVTVIPFYHGANRYLDDTYVVRGNQANRYGLMWDFLLLFSEALLLFLIGIRLDLMEWFFTLIAILLLFDVVWVGCTHFWANDPMPKQKYVKWCLVNFIAAPLLLISVWSTLWKTNLMVNLSCLAILITRTVLDYWLVWDFYYPSNQKEKA